MKKTVLVIAVHPDDETLGCGGTIIKHLNSGDKVYCLFVTDGNTEQSKCIDKITTIYDFDGFYRLGLPELKLADYSLNTIIPLFGNVINEVNPSVLYIPNSNDCHSDHRKVFEACIPFMKSFRYPYLKEVYLMEVLSETECAPALVNTSFIPNTFVDITEYMSKKLSIMELYQSEILEGGPRSNDAILALARFRGARINVRYAESFMKILEIR